MWATAAPHSLTIRLNKDLYRLRRGWSGPEPACWNCPQDSAVLGYLQLVHCPKCLTSARDLKHQATLRIRDQIDFRNPNRNLLSEFRHIYTPRTDSRAIAGTRYIYFPIC